MEQIELLAGDSAREKWARVINEHRGSGLAVAGLCRERSLAISSFYGRRRRLESPRAGAGFVEVKGVADSRGARSFGVVAPESVAVDVESAGVRIAPATGGQAPGDRCDQLRAESVHHQLLLHHEPAQVALGIILTKAQAA